MVLEGVRKRDSLPDLTSSFVSRSLHLDVIVDIPVPHDWQIRILKVRVDCARKIALRGLGATVLEQLVEFLYGTCSSCEPLAPMGQAHRGPGLMGCILLST